MEYNKIIAVTGLPGLYELLSSKTDGAIVRSLDDKTTRFVSSRVHNFSHLESIEVYTVRDNVNLVEILQAMDASNEKLPDEKDGNALKAYFTKVYPDLDFTRVYSSDLKKMVKWLTVLKTNNVEIKLTEPEEENEPADEEAADETGSNAGSNAGSKAGSAAAKSSAKQEAAVSEKPAAKKAAPEATAKKPAASAGKAAKESADEKPAAKKASESQKTSESQKAAAAKPEKKAAAKSETKAKPAKAKKEKKAAPKAADKSKKAGKKK